MAAVSLVPMSPERFVTWRAHSMAGYASDLVRSGRTTEDEALPRAEAELKQILPNGLDTPGHDFWSALDDTGHEVGILWVGPTKRPGQAFIYDIAMNPDHRGEGFGTATLQALEAWCLANGFTSIGLHVFGHNEGAWRLYKRMGFVETDVQMEKRL